jgi:hypothetical protein
MSGKKTCTNINGFTMVRIRDFAKH